MKKKLFTLCLIVSLSLTMTFTGTGSAFAGTSTKNAAPVVGMSVAETGRMHAMAEEVCADAVNINTENDSPVYQAGPYTSQGWYVPVRIPAAGNFLFHMETSGECHVSLHKSKEEAYAGINPLDEGTLTSEEGEGIFSTQVKAAGTYYLLFRATGYSSVTTNFKIFYAKAHKSGGSASVTLKSGKTRYVSVSGDAYRYFKITVPGTRNLRINALYGDGDENSRFRVKLYNASKKKNLLKGTVTLNAEKEFVTYAGVPKGTYYIAVSTKTDSIYGLKVSALKVTEKSGSTKAKAKTIRKGDTRKGIITTTQSSSSGDWYKFTVGSNQVVYISLNSKLGGASGGLRFSAYQAKDKKTSTYIDLYDGWQATTWNLYSLNNGGRLAPGTYYIKVHKYGNGTGSYTLQWK